jgi:transketolase
MGLALYVVLESYYGLDAEEIFDEHGVHPGRCERCMIDCSSGSLGQGLPIAVGMALANRNRNVYCVISDGECAEGSIWEALRIRNEVSLDNLKIYCIFNGWSAYGKVAWNFARFLLNEDIIVIDAREQRPDLGISGQDAHYHVLTKEEYETLI